MAPRISRPTDAKSSCIASASLRVRELRLTKRRPEMLPRKEAPRSTHFIFDFGRLISCQKRVYRLTLITAKTFSKVPAVVRRETSRFSSFFRSKTPHDLSLSLFPLY
jgi:hypothetical protein